MTHAHMHARTHAHTHTHTHTHTHIHTILRGRHLSPVSSLVSSSTFLSCRHEANLACPFPLWSLMRTLATLYFSLGDVLCFHFYSEYDQHIFFTASISFQLLLGVRCVFLFSHMFVLITQFWFLSCCCCCIWVCVCVCEHRFHPSIHPVLWEHVHACVSVLTSYPPHPPHFSEQIMSAGADWNDFEFSKAPNPWEHTCSCKPQTVQVPHFKRLLSFSPSPLFAHSFSPPPPAWLQLYPSTEPGAYWNTFPWSSLLFKVDFHPRARFEGRGGGSDR